MRQTAHNRVDLLFFHRSLRCLIVIDLKLDEFTHADAGQMHLYLKHDAVVRYALEGLPNKILAAEYRTNLPDEKTIAAELEHTRQILEERRSAPQKPAGGISTRRRTRKAKR